LAATEAREAGQPHDRPIREPSATLHTNIEPRLLERSLTDNDRSLGEALSAAPRRGILSTGGTASGRRRQERRKEVEGKIGTDVHAASDHDDDDDGMSRDGAEVQASGREMGGLPPNTLPAESGASSSLPSSVRSPEVCPRSACENCQGEPGNDRCCAAHLKRCTGTWRGRKGGVRGDGR
jgi:hypothetical protein